MPCCVTSDVDVDILRQCKTVRSEEIAVVEPPFTKRLKKLAPRYEKCLESDDDYVWNRFVEYF